MHVSIYFRRQRCATGRNWKWIDWTFFMSSHQTSQLSGWRHALRGACQTSLFKLSMQAEFSHKDTRTLYRAFKTEFVFEKYLIDRSRQQSIALCKFRTSNHSGPPSERISDVYILPTPRRPRAAQATTIAPRWQTLWRQHGPFGGTLARIFGPRIWRGRRTPAILYFLWRNLNGWWSSFWLECSNIEIVQVRKRYLPIDITIVDPTFLNWYQ